MCWSVLAGVLVWMLSASFLHGKSARGKTLLFPLSQRGQFRQEKQRIARVILSKSLASGIEGVTGIHGYSAERFEGFYAIKNKCAISISFISEIVPALCEGHLITLR
jgi:hypothetical protein